jgi:hypothetical protein
MALDKVGTAPELALRTPGSVPQRLQERSANGTRRPCTRVI